MTLFGNKVGTDAFSEDEVTLEQNEPCSNVTGLLIKGGTLDTDTQGDVCAM